MTLGTVLSRLGVHRTFGEPIEGMPESGVRDRALARLLADADGAVGSGIGAHFDGDVLTITSRPGATPAVATTISAGEVVDAVVDARRNGANAVALTIAFDPAADAEAITVPPVRDPSLAARLPAPELSDALAAGTGGPMHTFDLILAGSEVIRADAVQEMRDFADATNLGVVNLFTAKGMFRWDSPFHLGTAGLQLHDFTLAGLAPDRPILAVGVGRDECPEALLRDAGIAPDGIWPIVRLPVDRLAEFAGSVRAAQDGPPVMGQLFTRLWDVAQPHYKLEDVPLNPARAAADISESLPEGAVVTLEPGTVGWWIARALPTTQIGSVKVPAAGRLGLAVAAAVLHALDGTRAIAVVAGDEADDAENVAMIELARSRGLDLVVARWGDAGADVIVSPEAHRARLAEAFATGGVQVIDVPVEFGPATELLVAAAGPLAAWS